jgi:multidrug efflux system membrane fusion protein
MTPSPPPYVAPALPPRKRAWVRILVVVAIVAAVALGAWLIWGRSDDTATPKTGADTTKTGKAGKAGGKGGRFAGGAGPAPVTVETAKIGDVSVVQTGLGTATANKMATVRPRVDGQLASANFAEGQLVKAGDLLAQIDPVPFQVALSQVEGQLARDAASLNNARLDLDRYRTLLAQDSIATQQVDAQASLVKQLEGTVKVDQAQVDNAKLQLSYTRITAPITGRAGLRQVDEGNMVRGSDTNGITVITQVDPITVLFTIPQDTLPRILARLRAGDKPVVEAWDRDQKSMLAKGFLITTDNQIDVTTGTVKLKAQFANAEFKLFPNQFVNVRMVVDVHKGVVVVPVAAIQRGNQGTIVYVVKDDNTVTLRPVGLGATEGNNTEIVSGLKAGERVITDGVDRIREGAKVEVTDPAAAVRTPRAPGADGKGGRRSQENMTPEQREEFKKRLETMTPEQREEMRKRREARDASPADAKPVEGKPAEAKAPQ